MKQMDVLYGVENPNFKDLKRQDLSVQRTASLVAKIHIYHRKDQPDEHAGRTLPSEDY